MAGGDSNIEELGPKSARAATKYSVAPSASGTDKTKPYYESVVAVDI